MLKRKRRRVLTYEEQIANIFKLEQVLDSGELYIGPDDYPEEDKDYAGEKE